MLRFYLFIFIMTISVRVLSQEIRLSGNVQDTSSSELLRNSVLMTIKFKDSSLVNYSRTNETGFFKTIKVPIDTYLVIISNPNFSDKTFFLVPNKNDTAFNFKNIILPPKSFLLNEVEIVAHREKMYYKGDTLMFTADSFKLKQEATVEDLLKKLPGVSVDSKGKITVQGKEVSQVLVDGDEFFGSDPTIATKNLNANTVETVQVYEKKNEDAEGKDETVKVMNLQLKEDAKKGYFGKASVASDFEKFYENDLLVNKFKNAQKISIFGLFANTPKQAFGWSDTYQYGLENESGGTYDEESNTWRSYGSGKSGIPQTLKTGFYYNDKLSKTIKLNSDYTFKQNELTTGQETNTQFFLEDTTFSNAQNINTKLWAQSHNFNLRWTQNLDSLTELIVKPKVNYSINRDNNFQNDEFVSAENELTRKTSIQTSMNTETTDANVLIRLQRNFMKKNRLFSISYQPTYFNSITKTDLNTEFKYFKNQSPDSFLIQKRTQESDRLEHNATVTYVEPLTKKWKLEVSYGFAHNENQNNRRTLDFDGLVFDKLNTLQSNHFKNKRIVNRGGAKLIYDVKKYRISLGTNYRNIFQESINVTNGQALNQTFNNILPVASFNYRINQGSNLSIFYNANAQQPDIRQMQPVVDNSDPNRIVIGNPNLRPSFSNGGNLNYYFYKGISDINFYAGANFNSTNAEINNKIFYDSLGRAVSTPVNIDGNYYGAIYLGGGVPVFKKLFKIDYNFSFNHNNNVGFVNDQKNVTQNTGIAPSITFEKEFEDAEITIGGDYSYNVPKQTISLQSNQPYYTYGLEATFRVKLFERLNVSGDGRYVNNGNRAVGYNINYILVNGSISYNFLKSKNLIVGFDANDILNQNISNQRTITSNQIVDTKTQIIKRYFLLRVTYKFTSQKSKNEDEDDE